MSVVAVLPMEVAAAVVTALASDDVSRGGLWNASAGLWQRYDAPWDGPGGTRGSARLLGTIASALDENRPDEVTVYRVTVTDAGAAAGWSQEMLCDDALRHGGVSLAGLAGGVPKQRRGPLPGLVVLPAPASVNELLHADVRDVLRTDVRDLVRLLAGRNRSTT